MIINNTSILNSYFFSLLINKIIKRNNIISSNKINIPNEIFNKGNILFCGDLNKEILELLLDEEIKINLCLSKKKELFHITYLQFLGKIKKNIKVLYINKLENLIPKSKVVILNFITNKIRDLKYLNNLIHKYPYDKVNFEYIQYIIYLIINMGIKYIYLTPGIYKKIVSEKRYIPINNFIKDKKLECIGYNKNNIFKISYKKGIFKKDNKNEIKLKEILNIKRGITNKRINLEGYPNGNIKNYLKTLNSKEIFKLKINKNIFIKDNKYILLDENLFGTDFYKKTLNKKEVSLLRPFIENWKDLFNNTFNELIIGLFSSDSNISKKEIPNLYDYLSGYGLYLKTKNNLNKNMYNKFLKKGYMIGDIEHWYKLDPPTKSIDFNKPFILFPNKKIENKDKCSFYSNGNILTPFNYAQVLNKINNQKIKNKINKLGENKFLNIFSKYINHLWLNNNIKLYNSKINITSFNVNTIGNILIDVNHFIDFIINYEN